MTYNCASMIRRAHARLPMDILDDVVVTDDGSHDGSYEVARQLGLAAFRHSPNRGYGGNLKEGLRVALDRGADFIVEVHGDGQFDPAATRDALPYLERGVDLVIGSRFHIAGRARQNGMPLIRLIANKALSAIDRAVLGLAFTEYHTGFRIYSRGLLDKVAWEANSDDYLFSFEIIAQAAYVGASVAEVPVDADYRTDHTSHRLLLASIYALQTFVVLAQFVLARAGLYHGRRFPRRRGKFVEAEDVD